MTRNLISKRTRREFREWLVSWTLREISDLFDDEGIIHVSLPDEELPSGMRRSLVEEYYAGVDWANPTDVRRVLNAYEHILRSIGADSQEGKTILVKCLERDGFQVEDDRILARALKENLEAVIRATNIVSIQHLESYLERIRASVDTDPELAIGSTKELVEATLKTVLEHIGVKYTTRDDIPTLMKKVQISLDLDPAKVDETKKARDTIKRILGSSGTIVSGLAELRNQYGSGHGRVRRSGLQPRHARLAVGLGSTLSTFLLETLQERDKRLG